MSYSEEERPQSVKTGAFDIGTFDNARFDATDGYDEEARPAGNPSDVARPTSNYSEEARPS